MSTYALLNSDNHVVNLIALEPGADWEPPPGHSVVPAPSEGCAIGDRYDGEGGFSGPVPASLSPLQARKALRQAGLKAAVDAYVDTLSEEEQEEWEYAVEVHRSNATLNTGWALLGRSQSELDDLFRLGATL